MRIILPKVFVPPREITLPLFFMAGPVLGGDDWQYRACLEMRQHIENFYAVVPCRYPENHPIRNHAVFGGAENSFGRQTHWERLYLECAAIDPNGGSIIFWLPEESTSEPRNDGQPYARDSYGELGEWRGRMISSPKLRVVIGAEKNFPGLSQISCNFNSALNGDMRIYPTLEETIEAAARKVI